MTSTENPNEAGSVAEALSLLGAKSIDVSRYAAKMERLSEHRTATTLLAGRKIAYLGYPLTDNVGDQLITLGTLAFFKRAGCRPVFIASVDSGRHRLAKLAADVVIVLHGGGNFGDIYRLEQRLREEVLKAYPRNRIVVLPQSLWFREDAWWDNFTRLAAGHPDLHFIWRDRASYEFATAHSSLTSYLAPDMAHCLWPLRAEAERISIAPTGPEHLFCLIRRDCEQNHSAHAQTGDRVVGWDWDELYRFYEKRRLHRLLRQVDRTVGRLHGGLPCALWAWLMRRFVQRASRVITQRQALVTSRLHGHIFACLLGLPSIVLDNSYGKNSGYFESWTHDLGGHVLVRTPLAQSRLAGRKNADRGARTAITVAAEAPRTARRDNGMTSSGEEDRREPYFDGLRWEAGRSPSRERQYT